MKKFFGQKKEAKPLPSVMAGKKTPAYTLEEIKQISDRMLKIPPHLLSIKQMNEENQRMRKILEGILAYLEAVNKRTQR